MRAATKAVALGLAVLAGAGAAMAGEVTETQARAMLFGTEGLLLVPADLQKFPTELREHYAKATSGKNAQITLAQVMSKGIGYYGAIVAPGTSKPTLETLIFIGNFHSPGAAAQAGVAKCEEAAKETCQVVAYLVPEGYEARAFRLSSQATGAFLKAFDATGAAAFAYSPATSAYAFARGADGEAKALEACNDATNGSADCRIAVSR